MGKLDRTKHAWDVMEHVLGGVRADDADDNVPHTRVVDLGARSRLFGRPSPVQLRIVRRDADDDEWPQR